MKEKIKTRNKGHKGEFIYSSSVILMSSFMGLLLFVTIALTMLFAFNENDLMCGNYTYNMCTHNVLSTILPMFWLGSFASIIADISLAAYKYNETITIVKENKEEKK